MEKVNPSEQKALIIELTQGREMADELKKQLESVTSPKTCEALIENILSVYDKALSMLTWRAVNDETLPATAMVELPQSHNSRGASSPVTEVSNGFSKGQRCHKDVSKKRKTLPKWSEQVRFCSTGIEGPLDDGHSWRKYGQKDILGANHPRAYYRCTHRNSRACLATKQVQRSDEDPSMVDVTYKGRHTCNTQAANSSSTIISDGKEMPKLKKARLLKEEEDKQRRAQQMLQHLGKDIEVGTEALKSEVEIFPSFSFSFTGVESEILESQFSSDVMKENDIMGSYSPAFLSPTTSDSNYFSSSCQIDNNNFGYNILQTSEPDLNDMSSTPTSVITNSPFCDLDFLIDQLDFDPSFSLDDPLAYF